MSEQKVRLCFLRAMLVFMLTALLAPVASFGQELDESFCSEKPRRIYKRFLDADTLEPVEFVYHGKLNAEMAKRYSNPVRESLGFCYESGREVHLFDTHYAYDVSLSDRKLVLTDLNGEGPRIALAVAPGSLDVRETRSVTPLYKNAWVDKNTAIKNRYKPSYFQGLPFVRVMTDKEVSKGWTAIGFHIKQNIELQRTYDSHGCVRLTKIDLILVDRVLRYGIHRHLPVNFHINYAPEIVVTWPERVEEHYKREKNFGGNKTRRGSDGLVIHERIWQPIPYSRLYEGQMQNPVFSNNF